jgi:hypothetical protein
MMLPNGDRAVVDIKKLREYCLSKQHPHGRHKARVFGSALGMRTADADLLRDALLEAARSTGEAVRGERDDYGQRFVLDFPLTVAGKTATVRSCWIILNVEYFPRLTSCYVL